MMPSCEFTLSEGKKLRRKDAFTTTAMRVYFVSLAHKQIILHSADFAGDKDMTFDFSDA